MVNSETLRKKIVPIGLGVVVTFVFLLHATRLLEFGFIQRMENIVYDARLNFSLPSNLDKRIVIVDIDEASLSAEGRWPWSRQKLAILTNQLFNLYKINVLGFDITFVEEDKDHTLTRLEKLAETQGNQSIKKYLASAREILGNDNALADAIRGKPVLLGYFMIDDPARRQKIGILPKPLFTSAETRGKTVTAIEAYGYGANIPLLQNAALGAGHFSIPPVVNEDGIIRRVPLLIRFKDGYYDTLSLAMARTYLQSDVKLEFAEKIKRGNQYPALETLRVGQNRIPVDEDLAVWVPYRSKQGGFYYISATDVIRGTVANPDLLKDAIVLVGTTAEGLFDLRATPVSNVYPGVEIHANILSGILDERFRARPAYVAGIEITMVLVLGLGLALALPFLTPLLATILSLIALAASIGINLYGWFDLAMILPLASSLMLVVALFVVNMSHGFFIEARGKRYLGHLFGQYVPPELVEEMSENPEAYSLAGEKRNLTVMFSDVRGFTGISENMDPKQLSELMNAFLTPMTEIIHRNRGTIDKYMGDAIMAFWGAPVQDNEHAEHALTAAMEMIEELSRLRPQYIANGWPEIKIGVGLNTGEMNVGNMGSEFRMAYTVMGDEVNLGSRLEGLTKQYGVDVIIGEATVAATHGWVVRELDIVRVKGKKKPVRIYEPVCHEQDLKDSQKQELGLYGEALKRYRHRDWDGAEMQFVSLSNQNPARKLYRLYINRITSYRIKPPASSWDGVFTHESK